LRSISPCSSRFVSAGAAIVALLGLETASAALELTLVPAWEGNYRPGSATEVLVRVVSPIEGDVVVSASDPTTTLTARRHVDTNGTVEVAFAIQPSASALSVRAQLGYGEPVEKTLQLVPLDRPLLPVVADGRSDLAEWLAPLGRYVPQPVAAKALPRTAAGYGPVAALVLAADTLDRLTGDQLEALRAHVASCGRVLLPPQAEQAALELTALSACADRFVTRSADATTLAAALGTRPPPLPSYAQLLPLATEPPHLWRLVVWFFVGYLVLLAGLAWKRGVGWLRAAPVLASALMLAAWWQNVPERRVLLWAEQQSGAATARFRLLYDVHSRGTNRIEVEAPAALGLPEPVSEQRTEIELDDGATRLAIEPRLLARYTFGFSGTVAFAPSVVLERGSDGTQVVNRGAGASAPAILVRAGRFYAVPPLEAGETWSPAPDAPHVPRPALPASFAPRGDALLLEVPVASLGTALPPHDSARAWLALHFAASEGT